MELKGVSKVPSKSNIKSLNKTNSSLKKISDNEDKKSLESNEKPRNSNTNKTSSVLSLNNHHSNNKSLLNIKTEHKKFDKRTDYKKSDPKINEVNDKIGKETSQNFKTFSKSLTNFEKMYKQTIGKLYPENDLTTNITFMNDEKEKEKINKEFERLYLK